MEELFVIAPLSGPIEPIEAETRLLFEAARVRSTDAIDAATEPIGSSLFHTRGA